MIDMTKPKINALLQSSQCDNCRAVLDSDTKVESHINYVYFKFCSEKCFEDTKNRSIMKR